MMENVYKSILLIKWFKSKPYSWVSKRYFYTTINKLFWKFYIVAKYRKNTQYYKPGKIIKLKKYIDLHICKQVDGKYLIDSKLSDIYENETLVIRCLSKQDGSYIGCPHNTYKLLNLGIYKFWKLDDENAILGSTMDGKWYAWNGKDIARLKVSNRATVKQAKEILNTLMVNPITIPDNYVEEINKGVRTETKHVLNQLKGTNKNKFD